MHAKRRRNVLRRVKSLAGYVLIALLLAGSYYFSVRWPAGGESRRTENAFQVLEGAVLIEHGANDGDSFRLRHGGREEVYRLYFVDACERSDRYPKRLIYQSRYFGGHLSPDEVMALGEEARAFTLALLRREPFEVCTRNETVMESARLHAMIRFPGAPEGRRWLSERLVSGGLARIYTKGTDLPDGTPRQVFTDHLERLEAEARSKARGAWSRDP